MQLRLPEKNLRHTNQEVELLKTWISGLNELSARLKKFVEAGGPVRGMIQVDYISRLV